MFGTKLLLLFALTCLRFHTRGQTSQLTIQTTNGPILGSNTTSSWTNKTMFTFLGIPFAAPPVGDLRFKLPVDAEPWNTTLDCTGFRAACMQTNNSWFPALSEDCLYLNVYSPDVTPASGLAPVFIWIHGGGFVSGTAAWYHPDKFVEQGVVVVTVNYRLGVFGFLNLGTIEAPGNMGLFDNIMAMRWVQREISKFGGDPDQVTIGGESAGSMMSHLHYLSPASKGLFQRVIGESGTSLAFAVTKYEEAHANQFIDKSSCFDPSNTSIAYVYKCLSNKTADQLLTAQHQVTSFVNESIKGNLEAWVVTVDKDSNVDNPFLPELPITLMQTNQGSSVPFLMGTNRDEGSLMLMGELSGEFMEYFTANMRDLLSDDVLNNSLEDDISQKIEAIKTRYFNGKDPSLESIKGYVDLNTDLPFAYVTAVSAKHFYNRGHVFLYKLVYESEATPSSTLALDLLYNLTLVGHADELSLLLFPNTDMVAGSRDDITQQRLVKMWTNFIKFGTPTPSPDGLLQNVTWTPVNANSSFYLEIGDNLTMVQADYVADTVEFWDNINSVSSTFTTDQTPSDSTGTAAQSQTPGHTSATTTPTEPTSPQPSSATCLKALSYFLIVTLICFKP